jgi:hypothetical protein
VNQHREPGRAIDQRADRGALESDDEVAFPVPRHGTVVGFGRTLADQDVRSDMCPGFLPGPGARDPQGPAGAQAGDEFACEGAAALDVEGLVDRLVTDPHGLIIRELDWQPVRDLFRAPRARPGPVGAMWFVAAFPDRSVGADHGAVGVPDLTGQTPLDVVV